MYSVSSGASDGVGHHSSDGYPTTDTISSKLVYFVKLLCKEIEDLQEV